jgi:3-phosphoshikimate 1-carboxyvinyltransferase
MMHEVYPSELKGEISIPASKSHVQRFIAAAMMSDGESTLVNAGHSDDVITALAISNQFGANSRLLSNGTILLTGNFKLVKEEIFCRESGLCGRMFAPIASLSGKPFRINGTDSLKRRDIQKELVQLRNFGLNVESDKGQFPVYFAGKLRPGKFTLDCSNSSQLLSGLLFALPKCNQDSEIQVENLVSYPYVEMTLQMIHRFGVNVNTSTKNVFQIPGNQNYISQNLNAEGDWSAAANMLVAGALCGDIVINNVPLNSKQADRKILDVLEMAKVRYEIGDNRIAVFKSKPQGFDLDITDCPDLFPAVLPLAFAANTTTHIYRIDRLFKKESNRLEAAMREYRKLGGGFMKYDNEQLDIYPSPLAFSDVNSWGDHRIIMSLTIAGLANSGLVIHDSSHVSKSWPEFFNHINALGGTVNARLR